MKLSNLKFHAVEAGPSRARSVKNSDRALTAEKLRLKKATRDFESLFILNILKAMRRTIPQTGFLDGGLGQDVYNSMFDMELAKKMADNSAGSLAEILYRSLEKHLSPPKAGNKGENEPEIRTRIDDGSRTVISRPTSKISEEDKAIEENKIPEPIKHLFQTGRPKIGADPILETYGPTIEKASKRFGLNPRLIYSIIMAESGGDPAAVSSKGAKGLMQLMDDTASEMGVVDSLNPRQNIWGGTKYFRQLLDRYAGNLNLALAAYNAGPGTVSKYNGVPPFDETRRYIEKVLAQLHSPSRP
jgi:Rod binding domain-containing protein